MHRPRAFSIVCAPIVGVFGFLLAPQFGGAEPAVNLHGTGIVYLHGKGSWPGGLDGGTINALKEEGALVATPEMPWSFHRRYDATYDQALAEIDAALAGFKAGGASRVGPTGH